MINAESAQFTRSSFTFTFTFTDCSSLALHPKPALSTAATQSDICFQPSARIPHTLTFTFIKTFRLIFTFTSFSISHSEPHFLPHNGSPSEVCTKIPRSFCPHSNAQLFLFSFLIFRIFIHYLQKFTFIDVSSCLQN